MNQQLLNLSVTIIPIYLFIGIHDQLCMDIVVTDNNNNINILQYMLFVTKKKIIQAPPRENVHTFIM